MRDAESTLDQLISFCGDKIEEADVLSMFGLTAQNQFSNFRSADSRRRNRTALAPVERPRQSGKDLGRLLTDLLNHFRNLLIFQVSSGDLNLLEVSEAEAASLNEQSALADANASRASWKFWPTRNFACATPLRKRFCSKSPAQSHRSPQRRQPRRRSQAASGFARRRHRHPAAPAAPQRPQPAAPVPRPAQRSEAGPVAQPAEPRPAALRPFRHFKNPQRRPSRRLPAIWKPCGPGWSKPSAAPARFTRSYLLEAHPVSFAKNVLTIGFDPEFEDHIAFVDNARNHTLLQTKLAELGHSNSQFKFIKAERPANRVPAVVETPAPTAVT